MMQAKSPSAFFISLTLHGFAAALIFVTTVYFAQPEKVAPVIFELVASPSTAPDELVAPALGNSAAPVKPAEAKVEPPPVQEVPKAAEPEVREEVPAKPAPAKVKPDPSFNKELKKNERIAFQDYQKDYLKKHPTPKPAPLSTQPPKAGNVPRIDSQGIANGVRGGSTTNTRGGGGGKAMTREEADAMQVYQAALHNRLGEAFDKTKPAGLSDSLVAEVEFTVAASGEISNIHISHSSGNQDFDQSALDAFRQITWPGARPDHKSDLWRLTFRMKEN